MPSAPTAPCFGVRSLEAPSVRRRYETNRYPRVAGPSECRRCNPFASATNQPSGKCSPIPQADQAPAKDVEQGQQETKQSHEESRESATQGDEESEQKLKPSPKVAFLAGAPPIAASAMSGPPGFLPYPTNYHREACIRRCL